MKLYKKLLSGILVLSLVLSLSSCTGGKTGTTGTQNSELESSQGDAAGKDSEEKISYEVTEPITIEWWHALESQYHGLVDQIIADFNEEYPLITVEPVYQGSYSDVNEKLIAAQAAGSDALPAVCVANTPYVAEYGASGLGEVLDSYIEADGFDIDDFGEGLITSTSYDGNQVALPFLISTQVMFYNKTMADAEGITMPESWDDMEEFLVKGTTAEHKATAMPGWDQWYFETFYLNQGVEIVKDDNTTDLGDEKAMSIAKQIYDWSDNGYLDWYYRSDDSTTMRQGFFDGKYLSLMHTSSLYNMYLENCDFEVGIAYYPGGDKERKSEVGGSVLVIPSKQTQEVKNAGWQFLKYLTSKDVNMTWARETGYMPTRNSVLTTQEGKDFLVEKPSFQVIYDNLDNINPRIQHPGYTQLSRSWMDAMGKAITEKQDIDALMAEAVKLIDEALDDAL